MLTTNEVLWLFTGASTPLSRCMEAPDMSPLLGEMTTSLITVMSNETKGNDLDGQGGSFLLAGGVLRG